MTVNQLYVSPGSGAHQEHGSRITGRARGAPRPAPAALRVSCSGRLEKSLLVSLLKGHLVRRGHGFRAPAVQVEA